MTRWHIISYVVIALGAAILIAIQKMEMSWKMCAELALVSMALARTNVVLKQMRLGTQWQGIIDQAIYIFLIGATWFLAASVFYQK